MSLIKATRKRLSSIPTSRWARQKKSAQVLMDVERKEVPVTVEREEVPVTVEREEVPVTVEGVDAFKLR